MKARIALTILTLLMFGLQACFAQTKSHKTESTIAGMTPEERVAEYCAEYYHHGLAHREYGVILFNYIRRDGLKAVPAITRIINEFDPTTSQGKRRDKDAAAYKAEILLASLDRFFRVRAFDEGRKAIDAMKREVERMRLAHFDTAPVEGQYSRQSRYEGGVEILEELQGVSMYDESMRDALALKYRIKLSDEELLGFSNHLTAQDAYYPGWSETEWYVDHDSLNEAGNPRQYSILKNPEPFFKAYLKYKAKRQ